MDILDENMRLLDYLDPKLVSRLSYFEKELQLGYAEVAAKRNQKLKEIIIREMKRKYRCRVTKENFESKYSKRLFIKMIKGDPYSHEIYLDKKKLVVKFSNKISVELGEDSKGRNKAIITIG